MTSHCAPSSRPPSALFSDGELGVGACSQAAAHARQVGQTYLRVGNLVEARKHLARAEQLLQIETPNVYDVPTTAARERRRTSHARLRRARTQLLRLLGTRLAALAALGGSALVPVERRAPAHCAPPDASGS